MWHDAKTLTILHLCRMSCPWFREWQYRTSVGRKKLSVLPDYCAGRKQKHHTDTSEPAAQYKPHITHKQSETYSNNNIPQCPIPWLGSANLYGAIFSSNKTISDGCHSVHCEWLLRILAAVKARWKSAIWTPLLVNYHHSCCCKITQAIRKSVAWDNIYKL